MSEPVSEATEQPQTDDQTPDGIGVPETESEASESYSETFDRDYVQKLRNENSKYRVRSKKADDLAHALVAAFASETGRLHDPSDLAYSDELLDEQGMPSRDQVAAAVETLVSAKPHLAKIRVTGDVGQGVQGQSDNMPSFGALLKQAAG